MKIGLFGGTFDPPHPAHIRLAEAFYRASDIDLLLVMPTFIPPHKADSATAANHRLAMVKRACLALGERGVCYAVDDYEIAKGGASYTYETVRHLMETYGGERVRLCVGSDMLMTFERWREAEELMQNCVLYTMVRENGEKQTLEDHARMLTQTFGAEVHIMEQNAMVMSSTMIRSALSDGAANGAETLLDSRVAAYIEENGLYTGGRASC